MGKGSRETRKPKKVVEKTNASNPSLKGGTGTTSKSGSSK